MQKLKFQIIRCLHILRAVLINPFYEWRRFWLRVERRVGIPSLLFSPTRVYIRAVEKKLLKPLSTDKIRVYGNYELHAGVPLSRNSVVYSAGIGQDINFDSAVFKSTGASIVMIDPTPRSKTFIESLSLPPQFKFFPLALYTYDGEISFYSHYLVEDVRNSPSFSVHNETKTLFKLTVPCKKLSTLMKQNNHQHIDVLKMDIEGAAEEVLRDALDEGIRPGQVVCELEFPGNPVKAVRYLNQLSDLFEKLKKANYDVYTITQTAVGSRIEILAVQKSLLN